MNEHEINNSIKKLIEKFEKIKKDGWIESKSNGTGAIGITFEKMLGKQTENFELPDYNGIEIKTKTISNYSKQTITLFSAVPDSQILICKEIFKKYAYTANDKKKKFYIKINSKILKRISNKYYFKLYFNDYFEIMYLLIFNKDGTIINNNISWSYKLLKEKCKRKLKYLAYIEGYKKNQNNKIYYKYENIKIYKLKNEKTIINLLKEGCIEIDFKLEEDSKKKEKLINHGISFIIKKKDIEKLYTCIK